MQLTPQSLAIGIAFIIITIVFILNTVIIRDLKTPSTYENLIMLALLFVVIVPIIFMQVYVTQCMIHGGCNYFATAIAIMSLLLAIIYLIMFIIKMYKKKKENTEHIYS